jgi:predicted house-cleaning noncanonical NTP pyrophosphatase (MazG superfamily)
MVGKLVRDKIPDLMRQDGQDLPTGRYSKEQFRTALLEKLVEEAIEARATKGAEFLLTEELGDLVEVMEAVAEEFGLSWDMVHHEKANKLDKKGGFSQRYWVDFK